MKPKHCVFFRDEHPAVVEYLMEHSEILPLKRVHPVEEHYGGPLKEAAQKPPSETGDGRPGAFVRFVAPELFSDDIQASPLHPRHAAPFAFVCASPAHDGIRYIAVSY